jgi:transcriptional regulator with XRE-family HTH domain
MSQTEVAYRTGLSAFTIKGYERASPGRRGPNVISLTRLAAVLDVSVGDFFAPAGEAPDVTENSHRRRLTRRSHEKVSITPSNGKTADGEPQKPRRAPTGQKEN